MKEISKATGFLEQDIHQTLYSLNLLRYWKDEYILEYEDKYLLELFNKYYVDMQKDRKIYVNLIRKDCAEDVAAPQVATDTTATTTIIKAVKMKGNKFKQ